MDHVVYVDSKAKEMGNLLSGSKTMIIRGAAAMGANAIVGVDVDYEVLGQANKMLMVTASGTAVVVE